MIKRFLGLVFIFGLLALGELHAQEPFVSIIENTNNSHYGYWNGYNSAQVLPLDDGGYIIKDYVTDPINSFADGARITRFNKCHNKVWCKIIDSVSFGNSFNETGHSFIKTSDNYFISCDLIFKNAIGLQPIIIKLDSNGNRVWEKVLSHQFNGSSPLCAPGLNGGFIIAFMSEDTNSKKYFINFTKFNSFGNVTNSTSISSLVNASNNFYGIYNLLCMPGGGFLVAFGASNNYMGTYVTCLNSNGIIMWLKSTQQPIISNINQGVSYPANTMDNNGNFYISSLYLYKRLLGNDIYIDYIEKMDKNGKPLWFKYILDTAVISKNYIIPYNMGIGKDGQLATIIFSSDYGSSNNNNYWKSYYVKFDSAGKFNFAKLIRNDSLLGGSYNSEMPATIDSGFLLLNNRYFNSNTNYPNNLMLLKLDQKGHSTCLGRDTTFTFQNTNFKTIDENYLKGTGVSFKDTVTTIHNGSFKEKIICSTHFYPIADIGPDTVACTAKSYTIYVGDENIGANFKWSTGDTAPKITVTKSGKYWVRMSYGFCTSSDTFRIVFKSDLKTGLLKKMSVCLHDSALLQPKDTSVANYYWLTPEIDQYGDHVIVDGNKLWSKDTGNYYLMLKGTVTCPDVDTVHIALDLLPKASAGPDTILCRNQIYTMQGAGGITYLWKPAEYLSSATDPNAKASLPNTQLYVLVVTNSHGCKDSSRVLLKVRSALQVKAIAANATICFDDSVLLNANAHGGDSLHYHFYWPGDQLFGKTVKIKPLKSGWHKVVLSDNCTSDSVSDSVFVNVIPAAKAAFDFVPGNPIKTNQSVNFLNKSQNASAYFWTFGSKDSSHVTSPVYIYSDTGNYKITLVAYGNNGCPNDTAFGYIKVVDGKIVIYIPNSFTPNGDGINDYFNISGIGIKSYSFDIYNRWGEHIFRSSESPSGDPKGNRAGWDGTFRGVSVPESVYLYQLDVVDSDGYHHYLSGTVTRLR